MTEPTTANLSLEHREEIERLISVLPVSRSRSLCAIPPEAKRALSRLLDAHDALVARVAELEALDSSLRDAGDHIGADDLETWMLPAALIEVNARCNMAKDENAALRQRAEDAELASNRLHASLTQTLRALCEAYAKKRTDSDAQLMEIINAARAALNAARAAHKEN